MPLQDRAGAVVYAKNLSCLSAFYSRVAGFSISHSEADHVVLESSTLQLVVVAIPEHIASLIEIQSPPVRRESTPLKLVLPVASLSAARVLAAQHGGQLDAEGREWEFQGSRVCDGQDPEGNVFQLRQNAL